MSYSLGDCQNRSTYEFWKKSERLHNKNISVKICLGELNNKIKDRLPNHIVFIQKAEAKTGAWRLPVSTHWATVQENRCLWANCQKLWSELGLNYSGAAEAAVILTFDL